MVKLQIEKDPSVKRAERKRGRPRTERRGAPESGFSELLQAIALQAAEPSESAFRAVAEYVLDKFGRPNPLTHSIFRCATQTFGQCRFPRARSS